MGLLFTSLGLLLEERGCGFMRPGVRPQALTIRLPMVLCVCLHFSPCFLPPIKCSSSKSVKGIIKTARVDFSDLLETLGA